MTTPAGWYDDGSGRQRWWDGQQWTEHFAPEATDTPAIPEEQAVSEEQVVSEEQAVSEGSVIDDTVIRASDEAAVSPETQEPSTPTPPADQSAFDAPGATAATTPLGDDLAAYAAPAAPVYPAAASAPSAGAYPGTAPAYPGSATGYPAAAPYGQPGTEEPKKLSVLGLVGLGLAVIGTILVFIPVIGFIGFILLAAAFVVSLISLFLKGKKWPGITGLILAVVGTIIGIVMSFVYLFAFAQGVSEEIDKLPTSSPSIEATAPSETEGTTGTGRPTAEELAVGIGAIIQATGAEGYTPEHIACFADEFAASDIDDETLRIIASGTSAEFNDPDVALAFTEEFADALPVCILP
jgi:hypothetical protein